MLENGPFSQKYHFTAAKFSDLSEVKKKSSADCITLEIQSRETFFLWQFWNESAFENSRM